MSGKKLCVTCSKSVGITLCEGCQQTFCGKHSIEHRHGLASQLDCIMQEHDLLQQELGQLFNEHSLFKKIDQWENESIRKIQVAAETARTDLRQIIEKSRERLSIVYRDIALNLRSSREADDYSEIDLTRWMEEFKQLQLQMVSFLPIKLVENERSVIRLISIQGYDPEKNINHLSLKHVSPSLTQERFSTVIGNVILDEEGLLAKHTNDDWNYEYILGERLYSEGRQTVLFKIEQSGTPYNIFFGCISSQAIQSIISVNSSFTLGWFGYNQIYQHAVRIDNSDLHGYSSQEIATNDILHLTFDCDKKQIELFHEDTNKNHVLRVNIAKTPFPWQLLMVLTDKDDCVRILPIPRFYSSNKIQTDLLIE
jgi:hypothetical protein